MSDSNSLSYARNSTERKYKKNDSIKIIEKNKNKKIIIIIASMLLFTIILGIGLILIIKFSKKKNIMKTLLKIVKKKVILQNQIN